ncbi:P-loop containing nucleoside triphosphate hydrolase protein [Cantharellus anzutake]|uniref:P-loop containing nucleoside triphosphate hydrolase protein n=1 Tax=Cantharellus anzutake TaxID=1750568 RepID=UPI001906D6E9|nr:P-loop containing nucleoside triphosphate hydrolase protein [Cantharellus anzutake]KAF8336499.1 P-loop containing nucleoside triphosphate hydrolase protein [Cantharellus anzutake]
MFDEPLLPRSPSAGSYRKDADPPKYRIVETQWGIWRILTEFPVKKGWFSQEFALFRIYRQLQLIWECAPVARKFLKECYSLAPLHLIIWILARLAISVSGALSLYISSLVLDLVESFVERRRPTPGRLMFVVTTRIVFSVFQWASHEILEYSERVVRERLKRQMVAYKVQVYSRLDVPTANDPTVRSRLDQLASSDISFKALFGMTGTLTKLVTIMSQLSVLLAVFRHEKGGAEFAALALIQPLFLMFAISNENPLNLNGVFAVFHANPYHRRMTTIESIVSRSSYREELVGSGLRNYVLDEYNKADKALGDTPINDPWDTRPPITYWKSMLPWITLDLPWILFAVYAYYSNGSLPLKALMLLEQSVSTLTFHAQDMIRDGRSIVTWLQNLRQVYDAVKVENQIMDGILDYPQPNSDPDMGMKVEFNNVSFSYPQSNALAIRNMSFKINPGQICVVVGENGCGKSSTTKLLLRLFDADAGEIIIDDRPINSYKSEDLRKAMAVLRQDFDAYPLSIGENIGIGDVSNVNDMDEIRKAAAQGESLEFIEGLPQKFDSHIEGTYPYRDTLYNAQPDSLLQQRVSEMVNDLKLSGGQWQRLALSRTFMRANGVKMAIYDEPSASLDPKAEFALFERLRAMKGQRTMLFITHRFGHITKYADIILFMKNGTIMEAGSHEELLSAEGEYASLYNLQAQAFAPLSEGTDTAPEADTDPWYDDDS